MTNYLLNDRDLSWLSFNKRVLDEAGFTDLEVYDKIKFLAIHGSNLDEFARVRLAALESSVENDTEENGVSNKQILSAARTEVFRQSDASRNVLEQVVLAELKNSGIQLYYGTEVFSDKHYDEVVLIFMSKVLSYLQPVVITTKSDVFLEDRMLYFLVHLNAGRRLTDLKILLNIPSNSLPRFFVLSPQGTSEYIVYLDDIIRMGVPLLFKDFEFKGFYSIKINRNADLNMEEEKEEAGDFVEAMQRGLDSRRIGNPSRFQYDSLMPRELVAFCFEQFKLEAGEMLPAGRYLNSSDFFKLPNPKGNALLQLEWPSLKHPSLMLYGNYFKAIAERDYLLHFPYQSYDYVLVFFNLAVLDQDVTEIMATFYRVAQDSYIVNALISAAKNGKKVKAFVELKARFDEANNIHWANRMAEAGVEITYSIPGIKVHAKAALIKRRENGKEKTYAFFGTGNFNEKTASIYSDMGLFTSNTELCNELESVFQYLYKRTLPKPFTHLLVSQFGSLEKFTALIDHEIEQARQGKESGITIKVNNLEEEHVINKLYEASNAGVPVKLCVRSICRIRPGVKGMSENIQLIRVVGRFLEHSRIFVFHNNGLNDIFLGSADWMKRNLHSRVEVVFPLYDKLIKKQVLDFIAIQFTPATKTQLLSADLESLPWPGGVKQYCSQESFYQFLKDRPNHDREI
jgi:polyphosphate kinase